MNDEIERRNAESNTEQRVSTPAKAASKGGRGKKIAHSLVVASAVAVMSVYAAGYAATQSSASQIVAQASPVTINQTTSSTTSAYKDGTYTSVGTSRHGSIQATVVVQNGRIVSAQITGATTRYPTSRIASLPGQVVSKQSASVNYISGATDSSQAYLSAVASALTQAA